MPDPLLEAIKRNGRAVAFITISVIFYTIGRILDGAPKDPTASVMMIMALIALVGSFTIPQHRRIEKLEDEIKLLKLQLRGGNDDE